MYLIHKMNKQIMLVTAIFLVTIPLIASQLDPLNPPEMMKPPTPSQQNFTSPDPLQASLQNMSKNPLADIEDEAKSRVADTDKDGLLDWEEMQRGTNPNNPDTDGDGLNDSIDVKPLIPDKITAGLAPLIQKKTPPSFQYIKLAVSIAIILAIVLILKSLQSLLYKKYHLKGIKFSFKRPTVIKIRKRIVKNLEIEE